MKLLQLFLVLLIFLSAPISGEKILFYFGGGSFSMKNSAWPWATGLADLGHEVTFLSAHTKKPTNHPKIHDVTSLTLKKVLDMSYNNDRFQQKETDMDKALFFTYSPMTVKFCEDIIFSKDDPLLHNLVHNENFDLVIVNVIFGECGYVLAAKYNSKIIVFDGTIPLTWFFDVYGFHADSSWIPDMLTKYTNFPLTFTDRLTNTFLPLYWYWDRLQVVYPGMENILRKFLNRDDVPSIRELEKNASLVVVNTHPSTDFAYSLPPFVIQIGGMQAFLPEQEIPKDYQKFMDGAGPKGVVLISFGSTVPIEKLPQYYMNIFLDLIKKNEDVRFILKWKGPLPQGYQNLANLVANEWVPQRELLRHPNIKAFITQGGINSIQEATYYGIPMIVVPLFADQDYNAYRIQAQNVGFGVNVKDLTFQVMHNSLNKILSDKSYKKNMEIKSKIFRDRPNPVDTIIFWTQFVLRNDDVSALKPMNDHLSWFQRRLLDVYLAYFLFITAIITITTLIIVKLIKFICSFNEKKQKPKQKRS